MKCFIRSLAVLALATTVVPLGGAVNDDDEKAKRHHPLSKLEWRCIGPARGGRVTAVSGVVGDPLTYYMGATGGGVWKTVNAGVTWKPIADAFLKTGSVGAIAVAESDPNVVYVGMGERDPRGNVSHGDGVYRSVDAGKTWTHVGLDDSRHVTRLQVHPRDHELVYAAALGHLYGPNEQRGVYRSRDGGATWERILFVDEHTGAIDLDLDPNNPRVLYASLWQMKRTPWSLESGGPGSSLHKSTDGGDTWEELTEGLPKGIKGKISTAVSPVDSNRVYAMVEAEDGGVFRSDDAGETWQRVNEERSLRQRAWYYTHIYADPEQIDTVYVMNVRFHKSTDGGKSFDTIRVPHADNHDLWINPADSRNMINGNDGGANVTFDGGKSWSSQSNQATAQFYRVTVDDQYPYRVYGAQQDNSTASVSSRARPERWERGFYAVGGGESGHIAVRPDNPDIIYAGSYGGYLTRHDHETGITRNIMVWPENPMGWGADALKYRFQWNFPIVLSPHDPDVLYVAANVLFKSTDEGATWQQISPDLTTNDKTKQASSGGPITKDNTSVEYYCTIFALAESPHTPGVIWAGSDDGRVHITRDGGASWRDITPSGLAEWSTVNTIDVSPHVEGTAYLAVHRYRLDDFSPYVYRTRDFGRTWDRIDGGIGEDAFVRVVRVDPHVPGLLYAGTETGVYVSHDDGASWQSLQLELPAVPITDLAVKDNDLVAATQGRSFWILGGLDLVRQSAGRIELSRSELFAPTAAHWAFGDDVEVHFHLDQAVQGPVKLEFLDRHGEVIKAFEGEPKADDDQEEEKSEEDEEPSEEDEDDEEDEADKLEPEHGMNRFRWNTRYPDAVEVPKAVMWGGSIRGPRAMPGPYGVRLTIGDEVYEQPFEILPDPRLDAGVSDYAAQFDLLVRIRDEVSRVHTAVNRIRSIRAQVDDATARAKKADREDVLEDAAKAIRDELQEIEEALIQTKSKSPQDPLNYPIRLNNKIAAVAGAVARSQGRPTAQSVAVLEDLVVRAQPYLDRLDRLIAEQVPAFNETVRSLDLPAVWLEAEAD